MIRGLIFDLGGVAVEWSNSTTYGYIEEKYGIPSKKFKEEAERGMPLVQTGQEPEDKWMSRVFAQFGKHPEEAATIWGSTFESARYADEVIDLIQVLRGHGYKAAALSNLEPSRARWLRGHGIDRLFDLVLFSCEVGLRKPDLSLGSTADSGIFDLTLNKLGLPAEECIFVDDTLNCVKSAESTGIRGIQFKNLPQLLDELGRLGVN